MLEPDSEASLKVIEIQHGIFGERAKGLYSLSHRTFEEFFIANYIADNAAKGSLEKLVKNHLTENKWREVILLTAGMLEEGDDFFLLIKAKIDALADKRLNFLKVIQNDIVRKEAPYSPIVCRNIDIFYIIAIDIARIRDRERRLNLNLYRVLDSAREHGRVLQRAWFLFSVYPFILVVTIPNIAYRSILQSFPFSWLGWV